jgi:RimJ/RimL family protein N-acetyltransferase
MAVGYSGDVLQAKKRAEEAKNGVEIGYVIEPPFRGRGYATAVILLRLLVCH